MEKIVKNKKRYAISVKDDKKRYVIDAKCFIVVNEKIAHLFLEEFGENFIFIKNAPKKKEVKKEKKKAKKKVKVSKESKVKEK